MEIKREGNTLLLKGRLDTTTAPELEEAVKEFKDEKELTLDIKELEYVSSAGLRVFLSTHKEKGEGFVITNVSTDIQEIFEITGFSSILNIK